MSGTEEISSVVHNYLEALGEQDWPKLGQTLAKGVVRMGPYGDVVEGDTAYRDFLCDVVSKLGDYVLRVQRVAAIDRTVWVRLSETFTEDSGRRLHAEEALVFEVDGEARISGVEVYLRKSEVVNAVAEPSSGSSA
ncbi:MAG: nuclear transport factor 2 family protein [bacterium]|nr:nuclear transport factor 2 family protein [bacterium]